MIPKTRIGLLGYGYWGPNLLRNLAAREDVSVVGLVEPSADAQKRCRSLYPHIPVFGSLDELASAGEFPQGMLIATPPATHCDLAVACLEKGAHILVEKPLAASVAECTKILAAAERARRQVMVDHTFVYHPAIEYLDSVIRRGEMGDLLFYDSVRVNLGGFQPRMNALWDLAPHDLSILDLFLKGRMPSEVSAVGIRHFGMSVENLCYLNLRYDDAFMAHLCLNWIAPVKTRMIMVGGSKKMAVYDDNLPTEKVKLYDKGVSVTLKADEDFRVNYRIGDMLAPALSAREALGGVISAFLECVVKGTKPISDGAAGMRTVQILEAASASIAEGGRPVRIGGERIDRRRSVKNAA